MTTLENNNNAKRQRCELHDNEKVKETYERCKSGDIVFFDETLYFGYDIENIMNPGGIFSNDYLVFRCCGETIYRHISTKDYLTLIDHLKKKHDLVCVNCVEEDFKNKRIKITFKKKYVC